jgi:3-oxoadipate CoA-transferase alpha subunit
MTSAKLDELQMARRAAREISPGSVVAVSRGIPDIMVRHAAPPGLSAWFLSGDGLLDGVPLTQSDAAALARGGYIDLAIVSAAQVDAAGNLAGAASAAHPGLNPPDSLVDWAAGAIRVVALMPHTNRSDGTPRIVGALTSPVDGVKCVDRIITDVAVIDVGGSGLTLAELAPGWTVEAVQAITGAPLSVSPDLRVIDPSILGLGVDADQLAAMGVTPDDMPEDSAFEDSAFFALTEDAPSELGGPPVSKVYADGAAALADLPDGATVFIDGFGGPGGMAHYLLVALRDRGSRGLTIVSNTAGIARVVSFGTPPGKTAIDHSLLIENGQVAKAIASFPVSPSVSRPSEFELAYRRGEVDLELVPQGTLAERLRAGGAGIPAFYTPTGAGTLISEGKESRVIDGREYILEYGLQADYAIIRAHQADTRGNLVYRGTSRNFNAVMAPAARITVVEVDEIVESGELDPEEIVTPGVFVQRIVRRPEGFTGYE